MVRILLSAVLLCAFSAGAEYRAYRLVISGPSGEREVLTNFDQNQYPGVYPLDAGETIAYKDSWMCWGSQGGGVSPCEQPPKAQPTSGPDARVPASAP
jgi:hypothetical protein